MNETVMPLAEHMQIVVSDRHTFGTDAVVLADFARIRRRDRALDLGTGCGIIPLLWLRDARQSPVACLDIQDRAVRQVQQSIALDHLEERLTVQQADLRDHRQLYSGEYEPAVQAGGHGHFVSGAVGSNCPARGVLHLGGRLYGSGLSVAVRRAVLHLPSAGTAGGYCNGHACP